MIKLEYKAWLDRAACTTPETEYLREARAWDFDVTKYREEAVAVCESCPVILECFFDAKQDSGSEGIRGGEMFRVRSKRSEDESQSEEVSDL